MEPTVHQQLHIIVSHYLSSGDYNGLPFEEWLEEFPDIVSAVAALKTLIQKGAVGILSYEDGDNPCINRLGFPPIEIQLQHLKATPGYCFLYPTTAVFKTPYTPSPEPFTEMLQRGCPQLKPLYFEYEVLMPYALDPRYRYDFSDYEGEIENREDIAEHLWINLRSFGLARNGADVVVMAFPRYLKRMSPFQQCWWENHRIKDDSQCRALKCYWDNEINGCWNFPSTVYRAIIEEMENINILSASVYGQPFFKKLYTKDDPVYSGAKDPGKYVNDFDRLPFPSLNCYNDFILLFEKLLVDKINDAFLDDKAPKVGLDGKDLRPLNRLKIWLEETIPDGKEQIWEPLYRVREIRQKPAHVIANNEYLKDYFTYQQKLCDDVYAALKKLRDYMATLPEAQDIPIPHPDTQYFNLQKEDLDSELMR